MRPTLESGEWVKPSEFWQVIRGPHHLLPFGDNMTIINMTPHSVNLYPTDLDASQMRTFEPSGDIIRLDEVQEVVGSLNGAEVLNITFSAGGNLPPEIFGTYYIVSAIVANAYPHRTDFLMVARTFRGEDNQIKGCTAWATVQGEEFQ